MLDFSSASIAAKRIRSLTRREYEVTKLAAHGFPNKRIATVIGRSIKTVERIRHDVYAKLGARSTAQLGMLWAYAEVGLLMDSAGVLRLKSEYCESSYEKQNENYRQAVSSVGNLASQSQPPIVSAFSHQPSHSAGVQN